MKSLKYITGLLSMLSMLVLTTGCEENVGPEPDAIFISDIFSMIIVDENNANLLDPNNPENIIDKVEMEVVRSDGKILPLLWTTENGRWPAHAAPEYSKDYPYEFGYDFRTNCLIVGYWDTNYVWETSFKIRIPAYGIELSVSGGRRKTVLVTDLKWQVDGVDCTEVRYTDSTDCPQAANYKLILPVNDSVVTSFSGSFLN